MRELSASTHPRPPVNDVQKLIKTDPVLKDSDSWLARTMAGYAEQRRIIEGLNSRLEALEACEEKEAVLGR